MTQHERQDRNHRPEITCKGEVKLAVWAVLEMCLPLFISSLRPGLNVTGGMCKKKLPRQYSTQLVSRWDWATDVYARSINTHQRSMGQVDAFAGTPAVLALMLAIPVMWSYPQIKCFFTLNPSRSQEQRALSIFYKPEAMQHCWALWVCFFCFRQKQVIAVSMLEPGKPKFPSSPGHKSNFGKESLSLSLTSLGGLFRG